ncbi:MAG: TRAP transporter substrate-binding protein [Defluviitaleaceae bacterium]|nr:TRAP transporter substrate-binding protein [Defluviitaleaceae bacterium]
MKKSFSILLVTASLALGMAACAPSAPPAAPATPAQAPAAGTDAPAEADGDFSHLDNVTIRFAHWFAETHPQHRALLIFSEEAARRSGGMIDVQIFPNAILGSEDVYIDSIKQGMLEMGATGTMVSRDEAPLVALAEMPFLFSGWDHVRATLGADIGWALTEEMPERSGLRTLAWTANGFRQVSTNRLVSSMGDFSGLRLRVPNTPVFINSFGALGVNPVAMPFGETFTAMEQRVVDGQDNPFATVRASSFYEVQSHILETRHMFSPTLWLINDTFYQGLPEEFRQIIDESIAYAVEHQWQFSIEADEADKDYLLDEGIVITEVDSAFRANMIQALEDDGFFDWFFNEFPGTEEFAYAIRAME